MVSPVPVHPATRQRRIAVLAAMVCAVAALAVAGLMFGSRDVDWGVVADALLGGTGTEQLVITDLRVPRTALALVVGAGLGIAGAMMQALTRNALADPGILGVSPGAAFAVVCGHAFVGVQSAAATSVWAFGGAIIASAAVFAIASAGGNHANPMTLILGGAALSAVLGAMTSALILLDDGTLDRMRNWTVGSVAGRDMALVLGATPIIAIGILLALAAGPRLNLLAMGDEVASSLGASVRRTRIAGIAIIALLAGAATAAAGPIAFIGLVIPHLARGIMGPDNRWVLPFSAFGGATLMVAADIVGRLVARPGEVPAGIILAFVGAPFFLWLLLRGKVVGV